MDQHSTQQDPQGNNDKRVVFITGVLGGIGHAIAQSFAEAGWIVVGSDVRPAEKSDPYIHLFLQEDLADVTVPEKIMARIDKEYGRLDALINNAALQICNQIDHKH